MEVDLFEDCKGPPDEHGLLDVALVDVDRLDLLLGAHHRHHGGAISLAVTVAVIVVVVVDDGGRHAADLNG